MWDVAAGVIIGGAVVALVAQGIGFYTYSAKMPGSLAAPFKGIGSLMVLLGIAAAAWVIFFKASTPPL